MTEIRPFHRSDIAQVCALRRRVFRETLHMAPGSLEDYYAELFFDGPFTDRELSSLIAESDRGQLIGFIGVIPRVMMLNGAPIRMAVATELMVDPDRRGLAAIDLLRRLLAGPQDFTYSDVANRKARALWEALRGEVALPYSLDWTRPLRPWRRALNDLTTGTAGRIARGAVRPLLQLADSRLVRSEHTAFRIKLPDGMHIRPIDPAEMAENLESVCSKRAFHPYYSPEMSAWLLKQAALKGYGPPRCMLAEARDGHCLGWFVYLSNPGGTAQVLQVISRQPHVSSVLDAMFFDAWQEGVVELAGRADPGSIAEYSAKGCRFQAAPASVLVHSKNRDALKLVHVGQAVLTRLEGEWWMSA